MKYQLNTSNKIEYFLKKFKKIKFVFSLILKQHNYNFILNKKI